jgi:hypothetical protein
VRVFENLQHVVYLSAVVATTSFCLGDSICTPIADDACSVKANPAQRRKIFVPLYSFRSEDSTPAVSERPQNTLQPGDMPRSWPPDNTPYTRRAVPEDYAPSGTPAIPPGISTGHRRDPTNPENK